MLIAVANCSKTLANCCQDNGLINIISILKKILDVIQIAVPIILIVALAVQLLKMAINPDEKKGMSKIKNQVLATFLVFVVPIIINMVVSIMPTTFEIAACWQVAGGLSEGLKEADYKPIGGEGKQVVGDVSDYEHGIKDSSSDEDSDSSDGSYGGLSAGDAKGIIEGAEKVHTMYEQQKWSYYTSTNQLIWRDINKSTNNKTKKTCCATFVGSALLVGGVLTENQINNYNYNSAYGINSLLSANKWIKINSYGSLKAGDIAIMTAPGAGSGPGHVQIYAGNGSWYNAGSTDAIQRANPYAFNAQARFLYAWRIPA